MITFRKFRAARREASCGDVGSVPRWSPDRYSPPAVRPRPRVLPQLRPQPQARAARPRRRPPTAGRPRPRSRSSASPWAAARRPTKNSTVPRRGRPLERPGRPAAVRPHGDRSAAEVCTGRAAGNLSPAKLAQIRGDAAGSAGRISRPGRRRRSYVGRRRSCGSPPTCTATSRRAATPCSSCSTSSPTATTAWPRRSVGNALVGLIPTQNPDGRANNLRTNGYTFDMNRDWFARTQPETAGKLDLLWQYPPQLYVDEHEMGGTSYFFPPNSDPIYAETPRPPVRRDREPLRRARTPQRSRPRAGRFETYQSGYDLFYQGYGDTVPTTEFGAAGMTYEQGGESSYPRPRRASLHQRTRVAVRRRDPPRDRSCTSGAPRFVHGAGRGAALRAASPTRPSTPAHQVQLQVPDKPVCGYFLRGQRRGDPARSCAACSSRTSRRPADRSRSYVPDYTAVRPGARSAPRCRPAPTGSPWRSRRSTGYRRCSTRTPTCRSRTSTTSAAGATRCSTGVAGGYTGTPAPGVAGPRRAGRGAGPAEAAGRSCRASASSTTGSTPTVRVPDDRLAAVAAGAGLARRRSPS